MPVALLAALLARSALAGDAPAPATPAVVAAAATTTAASAPQDSAPATDAPQSTEQPAEESLSSTEQGRVAMPDSFAGRRQLRREKRRTAWRDTRFAWQLRTYDMDTTTDKDTRQAAWAVGGSAGFQTGDFADRYALGATAYTSQPLYAPSGEGGTNLLTPNQGGYSVLGEAYGQVRITDDIQAFAGRHGVDTPYINRNDTRMTPQTFEAAVVQGTIGGRSDPNGELHFGLGYVTREKQVNSETFESMSQIAGAAVERGVAVAGAAYTHGDAYLGLIDYYSADIINIAFTEVRYTFGLGEKRSFGLAAQYTDQHSVGSDLLTGTHFSTSQAGIKADLALGPTLFTAGYTETGRGDTLKSPWTRPPSFTSVQMEDFDSAGENALILRAAARAAFVPGMTVYGLWVHGSSPTVPGDYSKEEYDANLEWSPPSGKLRGLMFRVRYAYVSQSNDAHQSQLRLMLFYTPPK